MGNNNKKPALRFKGFTDDWEQRKVTELGKIFIGLVTTMTEHYTDEGALLIRNSDIKDGRFELGDNPIYLEKSFAQANSSRMHQLGDVVTVHTGDVGTSAVIRENQVNSIGFATIVTRPNTKIITSDYLCTYLNTDQHKKWAVGVSTGDGRTNYNLGDYYECVVPVPTIEEQQKISEFISDLNNLITLHQRKYDKLVTVKKFMLEKMFPKNGQKKPEIRFHGFTDDWEQRKFRDTFDFMQNNALSRADLSGEGGDVMNVHYGDVLVKYGEVLDVKKDEMTYLLDASLATKYLTSLLQNGDIIIADAAEDETVGKCSEIAGLTDEKVLSGLHTIPCRPRDNFAEGYLGYYMNSGSYHDQLLPLIQGTKVSSISKSAIQDTDIMYPKTEAEQRQIGDFFANLDNLITLHQRKCEKLKKIKTFMLQRMFV